MKRKLIGRLPKSFARVLSLVLTAAMVVNGNGMSVLAADNGVSSSADAYVQESEDASTEDLREISEAQDDTSEEVSNEAQNDTSENASSEARETSEEDSDETQDTSEDSLTASDETTGEDVAAEDGEDLPQEAEDEYTGTEDVAEDVTQQPVGSADTTVVEEVLVEEKDADGFVWGGTDGNTIVGYEGDATAITIPARTKAIGGRAFLNNTFVSVDFSQATELLSIGEYSFSKDSSGAILQLATVTGLEKCEKLTTIERNAFAQTKIASIKLPDSVNYIKTEAFKECVNLAEFTFPAKLSDIGDNAFSGCQRLTTVKINAVSKVGNSIFNGCDLKDVSFADGIVTIPENLFKSATFDASAVVAIPDTVTEIGKNAFDNAKNLTTVTFSEKSEIAVIGEGAFTRCESLDSVEFPMNGKLATIGKNAFNGCKSITEVILPDTLTELGASAFKNTVSLNTIRFSENELFTTIPDGAFEQIDTSALTKVEFPANIISIGKSAFAQNSNIREIYLPDTIKEVGSSAFDSITSATSLRLSNGMTKINDSTFRDCDHLEKIEIPDSIIEIGTNAFNGCNSVHTVTANKLQKIGGSAFANCNALSHFEFPKTLISIGETAFSKVGGNTLSAAPAFSEITIPENVESIGREAFASETSLTTITIKSKVLKTCGEGIFNGCVINTVNFPDGMEEIPANLFYRATFKTGTKLEIPSTVKEIGDKAFAGTDKENSNIVDISFDDPDQVVLEKIGNQAFAYNGSIHFTIPQTVTSIGKEAFAYNTSKLFDAASIPAAVREIGAGAFLGCTYLAKVVFEEDETKLTGSNLTIIEDNTFSGTALKDFDIPQGINKIGKNAFANCTSLIHVYFPSTVKTIDATAFDGCNNESLTFVTGDSTAAYAWLTENRPQTSKLAADNVGAITYDLAFDEAVNSERNSACYENTEGHAYTYFYSPECAGYTFVGWYADKEQTQKIASTKGLTGNITVYAKFEEASADENLFVWGDDGKTIKGLTEAAKNLDILVIPIKCEYIEAEAFKGNKNIRGIAFEQSGPKKSKLLKIGDSAFSGCTSLRTLDLTPCESLTEIGKEAFNGCKNLVKVKFPDPKGGAYTLGEKSFYGIGIETLTIPAAMQSADNQAFFNCSYLKTINMNSSQFNLRSAGNTSYGLFHGCKIEEVNFGSGVSAIPYGFFGNATFRDDFTLSIPDNIVTIEPQAFVYSNLSAIDFTGAGKLTTIKDKAFSQVVNLTEITLPEALTRIGANAFEKCTALTKVVCNEKLSEIGAAAFTECSNLSSCDLSNTNVKEIAPGTFNKCEQLTAMKLPAVTYSVSDNAFSGCTSLAGIELNDSLESIGKAAFESCETLTEVTMPDTLVFLGDGAFNKCSNLAKVTFSEKLLDIPNNAFKDNKALTEVKLSASTNRIGSSAFENCVSLTKADLGSYVKEIGAKAFYENSSLTDVVLGDNLEKIDSNAFYGCSNLKDPVLPDTLKTIGGAAFKNCTSLTKAVLPKSLESLGTEAFSGDEKVKTIYMNAENLKTCGNAIFSGCILDTVEFADGITSIPANFFNKTRFASAVELAIPSTVTTIGDSAFGGSGDWGVTLISKITFAEDSKLQKIGNYAFQYSSLESFIMPDGVTELGKGLFRGCKNLKTVEISAGAKSIPDETFLDASSLEKVTFRGNVITSIGKQAFDGAAKLVAIDLPYGVKSIGEKAFNNCMNLEFVYIPSTVTTIAKDAFNNVKEGFTISAEEGSYAYKWAAENKVPCTSENIHVIEYEYNGAKEEPRNIKSYRDNGTDKVEVIFYPASKTGYVFTGWYLDEKCSSVSVNKLSEIPDDYKTKTIKLYAGFELPWEETTYKISFIANAPNGFRCNNPATITVSGASVVKLYDAEDMKCKGLAFTGWNTQKDGNGTTYQPGEEVSKLATKNNETISLYGMWNQEKYNITYVLNGGTNSDANPDSYLAGDVVSKAFPLQNPKAPGGTKFVGWYDKDWKEVKQIEKGATGDLTLYARYSSVQSFTLKLKLGGTDALAKQNMIKEAVTGVKFTLDSTIVLPGSAAVERPGYVFEGWCTKAKRNASKAVFFEAGKEITASDLGVTKKGKKVTLYAIWSAPIDYAVSYDLNGGQWKSAKDAAKAETLKKHTVAKTMKLYTPKKDGYKFAGWDNLTTKNVEHYKGSLPKYVASAADLKAVWEPIKYKVTYNGNGGYIGEKKSVTYADALYDTNLCDAKINKAPAVEEMYNAGRTFAGWNTKKDGSGISFAAGAEITNLTTKNGKAVKLYAIWQ